MLYNWVKSYEETVLKRLL